MRWSADLASTRPATAAGLAVKARAAIALAGDGAQPPILVLFASQTGQAEALAWQTARDLHADGTLKAPGLKLLGTAVDAAAPASQTPAVA